MRLLLTEYKKIWKSKFNIVLLVVLFVFSGYRIYDAYYGQNNLITAIDYIPQDKDGNDVSKIGYYQKADELHHRYASTLNDDVYKWMNKDYQRIISSYQRKTPDVEYMREIYGEDYEIFLKDASEGKYTYSKLSERMNSMKVNGFSSEESDSNFVKAYFPYYYKEDRILALYHLLYGSWYEFESTRLDKDPVFSINALHNIQRRIEDITGKHKVSYLQESYQEEAQKNGKEKALNYYNQRYLSSSNKYDSVVGNTLFVNALNSIEFMTLIILVLLLANTFAMEKRHRMEQILIPSSVGWKKITMAKVSCGLLLSMGLIVAQVLMVVIISSILLPTRDLDLIYMGQARIFMNYNVLEYVFTYKEIILSGIGLMLLASMATALLTILCSYVTKSRFISAIPLLFVVIISGSMNIFEIALSNPIIDAFFPSHMFHFTQYFQFTYGSMDNVQSLFGHMLEVKDMVMIFWIIMLVFIILGIYLHSKKHHSASD